MHAEALNEPRTTKSTPGGIVYRTVCQNPGCGHSFDLRITAQNASVLSGMMACPRCRRQGGMLKPQGRIGDKLFAARLFFRMTGVGPRPDEEDAYLESVDLR